MSQQEEQQIEESSLNRILSHLKDKDVAMITAFRTNPDLQLSKTNNRKRNKKRYISRNRAAAAALAQGAGQGDGLQRPPGTGDGKIAELFRIGNNTGFFPADVLYCSGYPNETRKYHD